MQHYTHTTLHSHHTTLAPHYTRTTLHSHHTTLTPHYTHTTLHSHHTTLTPHYTHTTLHSHHTTPTLTPQSHKTHTTPTENSHNTHNTLTRSTLTESPQHARSVDAVTTALTQFAHQHQLMTKTALTQHAARTDNPRIIFTQHCPLCVWFSSVLQLIPISSRQFPTVDTSKFMSISYS